MGNCSQKSCATANASNSVRILTDSGRILDLPGPKLAREVLDDFPGYGIFQRGQLTLPMFEEEELQNGQLYYLSPFGVGASTASFSGEVAPVKAKGNGVGVWRVKMAINAGELAEMMSEEGNVVAVIERMRMAAVAGGGSRAVRGSSVVGWRRSPVGLVARALRVSLHMKRLPVC